MTPSPSGTRRPRAAAVLLAGLAFALLLLGGVGLWRLSRGAAPEDAPATAAGAGTPATAPPAAELRGVRLRLLPEDGIGADPGTVRIGIAHVAPQDAAVWQAWVRGGMQGAGPAEFTEMATVERWLAAPAQARADGLVEVGPLDLPAADRYVLQAGSADRLRWYTADFVRGRVPADIRPRLASGLRLRVAAQQGDHSGSETPPLSLLLRRVEGSRDADWQPLLRQVAPQVLAAYDDAPLEIDTRPAGDGADMAVVAPLPPGPVEVVVLAGGVEVLRRKLDLTAGRIDVLAVGAEALRSGAALATSLRLRFVDADSGQGLRPASVLWVAPDGERRLAAEPDGSYRIARVDPARPLRFDLDMAQADADGLPRWPEHMPLVLQLDNDTPSSTGEITRTEPLRPLRWLVVDNLPPEARMPARGGSPLTGPGAPPVYLLERETTAAERASGDTPATGNTWRVTASDAFRPLPPRGVAASLSGTGRHRLAVVLRPWRILRSAPVDVGNGAGRTHRTTLAPPARSPRDIRLMMLGPAGRLARTPVQVMDIAGAVPPWTVTTDAAGLLHMEGATEEAVLLEAPGFVQIPVRLDIVPAQVRLVPETE